MYLTPEQIAEKAERFNGKANRAEINRLYREQDESHKWPICGRFDATERAIRMARKVSVGTYGLEYAYLVDSAISGIVNGAM